MLENGTLGLTRRGAGNVTRGAGLKATAKAREQPPDPTIGAPVLDPTLGGGAAVTPPPTR